MDLSRIQKARKAAGITQEELSKVLDINRATISKYESGAIIPNLETAGKIAEALGVPFQELFDYDNTVQILMSDGTRDGVQARISSALDKLNPMGKSIAVERIEELAKIPDYQKKAEPSQPE